MLPKIRLGKRSTMGALVCPTCPSVGEEQEEGASPVAMATRQLGPATVGKVKLHPGQKVYLQCGSRECVGVVEQHNHMDNQVSVLLPELGQHVLRKIEDVWTSPATSQPSSSSLVPLGRGCPHPVSSCIDVPRSQRSPEEVDMDEMMAAMVLTSLSCSPLLHSPQHRDTPAALGTESAGGELSDSGSSGYWSVGCSSGSPAPSPPITEADRALATPSDEGLDMELEQVLFDEPAPRKRRNSMKVAYRCLWPSCGKILTSVVGIKRHIRTLHLGQGGEHERCSRSEEDFYYTEIHQRDPQAHTPPPSHLSFSPVSPPCTAAWSSPTLTPSLTPPPACGSLGGGQTAGVGATLGAEGADLPPDGDSQSGPLSQSAPSTSRNFWQVQSEHSYQAPPRASVVSTVPSDSTSYCWTSSTTSSSSSRPVASFRVRSVSVGEQWLQQQSAPIRPHPASVSPPRYHWPTRRVRGEAKKCRKVYGIEHRDQWCTPCRWKKACQRFLD